MNVSKTIISRLLSVDPDHTGHFIGPDLFLNCLQRLSADDTSR